MSKPRKLVLILLSFIMISASPVSACTIFTDAQGDRVMFAGNEDQSPNQSYLLVDTEGPIPVVFIDTPWQENPLIPQMGMNEYGLCFDINSIPNEELNMDPYSITVDYWPVPHIMRECSTVEEVLDIIFDYNWGSSISYQMHFADATGDAAVIHPGSDGRLTYTRKPSGDGYLISTNFNLERLKTGAYSCERFSTAEDMLTAEHELSVEFMASILDATHVEGQVSTIFSAVFDPTEGTIYLYYNHRFDQPLALNVIEEVAGGAKQVSLEELFEDGGSQGLFLQQIAPIILVVIGLIGVIVYNKMKA